MLLELYAWNHIQKHISLVFSNLYSYQYKLMTFFFHTDDKIDLPQECCEFKYLWINIFLWKKYNTVEINTFLTTWPNSSWLDCIDYWYIRWDFSVFSCDPNQNQLSGIPNVCNLFPWSDIEAYAHIYCGCTCIHPCVHSIFYICTYIVYINR